MERDLGFLECMELTEIHRIGFKGEGRSNGNWRCVKKRSS